MSQFKIWILNEETREKFFVDRRKWKCLVQELDMNPIAIGSGGFYQINYSFISQVWYGKVKIFIELNIMISKIYLFILMLVTSLTSPL